MDWILRSSRMATVMRRICVALSVVSVVLLNLGSGQALAQTSASDTASAETKEQSLGQAPTTAMGRTLADLTRTVNEITAELDRLDRAVERTRATDGELSPFREATEVVLNRALELEARSTPEQRDINAQIRRLGPAPSKDETGEANILATERKRLEQLRQRVADILGSAKVSQERARQLIGLIQGYRRTSFRNRLLERTSSPLSPSVWREVTADAGARMKQLGFIFQIWWKSIRTDVPLAFALAGLGFGILFMRQIAAGMIARYRDRGYNLRLDFQGRATSAFFVFLARAVPPVAIAFGIYLAISWFSDMPASFARMAAAGLWAFFVFAGVRALIWTLIATDNSEWSLLPLTKRAGLAVGRVIVAIAGVFAVGLVLNEFIEIIFAPTSLKIVLNAAVSLALAFLLLALARVRFTWRDEEASSTSRYYPLWLKIPLLLSAVAIIASTLLGFIDLARFLSAQVVVTGSLIVVAVFCWEAVKEFSKDLLSANLLPDEALPGDMQLNATARQRGAVVVRWVLNTFVLLATTGLVLFQWGFDWGDVIVWLRKAFFGFEIGAIRVSPAAILIGIGLFVFGVFLTRLLQRSLSNTLLSPSRMDYGLSNSIRTGVGYAGFALSALVAVSYAGFNFTNLAIVAGALSVGIGFGLQSIVNNFVSGLILLAERPIQVGDWIVVGDKEGYVRRISVRATVIETFDRASLIIPNSDLMTGAVTNWTYGNRLGRVVVKVGTSYDANPHLVYDTLLDIGRNCTLALNNPPPSVVFEDFASSTLNFSLRIYIADINNVVRAQTEIRMDIWKVFREKGIDIDFPQLDVHLKRD